MRLVDADTITTDFVVTNEATNAIRLYISYEQLKNAPTIDPIEHGRWIEHHEPFTWMGYTTWTCSKCGYECGYEKEIKFRTPCCPNCGARMDGAEEEEKKNVFELIQEKGREVADVFLKKRF